MFPETLAFREAVGAAWQGLAALLRMSDVRDLVYLQQTGRAYLVRAPGEAADRILRATDGPTQLQCYENGNIMAYNRPFDTLRRLARHLSGLPPNDPVRRKYERLVLDKLYHIGILKATPGSRLLQVEREVTVSALSRCRLHVVLMRLRTSDSVRAATGTVEQRQIRVGTVAISDNAFLVPTATDYPTT
ncbi:hypothetical protein BS50DRAFT_638365 [Corynespora cassiicola Philippines]|uniref:Small ribosomal subunit protein uS4 N-terminal domain-containing protein n=1 Tax=Corynespora cassiicola Philippines TaxID=1448308 RepID=A0A2T2NBZ5_CORCC|nr:hypothetical protein BS50DRAFT_638365 [Corynespora cassiicola Philippines]